MTQKKFDKLVQAVRAIRPDVLLQAAGMCDGHGIVDPKAFTEAGIPEAVVDYLTRTHKSDGSPKGSIFVKGEAVKELKGIYGLDALFFFANALGVEYRSCIGRGFQAQAIHEALRQHFQSRGT